MRTLGANPGASVHIPGNLHGYTNIVAAIAAGRSAEDYLLRFSCALT